MTSIKEETDEQKEARLKKEKEEEIAQALEDHQVCLAYGLYEEKNIEMYLPESEEEILEREKKEEMMKKYLLEKEAEKKSESK
jgi:hypothetical protein